MTIVNKADLSPPFTLDLGNAAAPILSSVYVFDDAGASGSTPAIIPDLLGAHDIDMIYGTNGEINSDGNLQLADNGNGQLNTYGAFQGIDSTWADGVAAYTSRIYIIDCDFVLNTRNFQYLMYGFGCTVFWTKSTGLLRITIENKASHRAWIDYPLVASENLKIVLQIDRTNTVASIIINGIVQTVNINGDPYGNGKPLARNYLGRAISWNNYYGWDGTLNLFCVGEDVSSQELTQPQLVELSLNPYAIFETAAAPLPLNRLSKKFTTQLNLLERVTRTHNVNATLLTRSSKSINVLTDLLSRVNKPFIAHSDLAQRQQKSHETKTELLQRENVLFSLNTKLLQRNNKSFSAGIDLFHKESAGHIIKTDFYQRIDKAFEITSELLSANRVRKSFNIAVDLRERMQKNFAVELDLLQRSSLNHSTITSMLARISKDFVTRFDLNSRSSYSHQLSLDFIQRVGKQYTIQITLLSDEVVSQQPKYVVTLDKEINFNKSSAATINFNEPLVITINFVQSAQHNPVTI